LKRNGVDAIIAQGSEAGGHRGTFNRDFGCSMIGTISLVPQIVDAVALPVIASGDIMDGRGIAAALALGADGVQMGTAFLACKEAGTSAPYKAKLQESAVRKTKTTRVFSGRLARGIENRFMLEMKHNASPILPFPAQNQFTRDLRSASAANGGFCAMI